MFTESIRPGALAEGVTTGRLVRKPVPCWIGPEVVPTRVLVQLARRTARATIKIPNRIWKLTSPASPRDAIRKICRWPKSLAPSKLCHVGPNRSEYGRWLLRLIAYIEEVT